MKIKKSQENTVDVLVWVCLYGGLLGIATAFALVRVNRSVAAWLGGAGSLVTALGIVLIYIRSRMK